MNIPGLIIEYLIAGACTLVWILPLLQHKGILDNFKDHDTLLFVPALYVLGMVIDGVAHFLVSERMFGFKNTVRKKLLKEMKNDIDKKQADKKQADKKKIDMTDEQMQQYMDVSATARELERISYSETLMKEMQWRSSRDRIARGAVINILLATVVFAWLYKSRLILLTGLIMAVIMAALWVQFQKRSYKFELYAKASMNKNPK